MKHVRGFYSIVGLVIVVLVLLSSSCNKSASKSGGPDVDPVGLWKSVDFVRSVADFQPGTQQWGGDLFLKDFTFLEGGRTSAGWTWEKDWFTHSNGTTRAQYFIKEMNGSTYLFLPWLSGDVTERGQAPQYYVLQR